MNDTIFKKGIINFIVGAMAILHTVEVSAQQLNIQQKNGSYEVSVSDGKGSSIFMPSEGLWSIATDWQEDWPSNWNHASPQKMDESGEWKILTGSMKLPEGDMLLQDAYRMEKGRVKCIRRFQWTGKKALEKVTLSARWKVRSKKVDAFLPGIVYYGNPSGEKNGAHKVPVFPRSSRRGCHV